MQINLAAVLKSFFQEKLDFFSDSVEKFKQKVSKIWIESQLKNEYSIP